MTEKLFMEDRVDGQFKWYSHKAGINKKRNVLVKGLVVVLSAIIPVIIGIPDPCPDPCNTSCDSGSFVLIKNTVIAILGAIIAIATGFGSLLKFQDNWIDYRTTAERLKQEKILYLTKTGSYDSQEDGFKLFVAKVEAILSSENTSWNQVMSKDK